MKRLVLLSGLLVLTSGLGAKIYTPGSSSEFFDIITRKPNAVVHYINYAQVGDDKLKQQALVAMKTAFADSALESTHIFASIVFVGSNSTVAPNLFTDLETKYQLKRGNSASEFSIVFLIKDGKPVVDSTGYLATLTDAFDQNDLDKFIQKYFGDYINSKLQQAEAERLAQPVRTVTRYVEQPVYVNRYYDNYYDDGYYGGYGWGPRFGIGIGFGGWGGGFGIGRGWGWGHRGWGHRGRWR